MLVHHRCPPSTISITFNFIPLSPCTYPCWYPFFHYHHMSTSPSHIPIILNPFNRSTSFRILLLAHLVSHLLLHPTHYSSIQLISPFPQSVTSTPSPFPVLCRFPTPTSATVAAAAAPQVPMPQVTPLRDRVLSREVWAVTSFSTTAATAFLSPSYAGGSSVTRRRGAESRQPGPTSRTSGDLSLTSIFLHHCHRRWGRRARDEGLGLAHWYLWAWALLMGFGGLGLGLWA